MHVGRRALALAAVLSTVAAARGAAGQPAPSAAPSAASPSPTPACPAPSAASSSVPASPASPVSPASPSSSGGDSNAALARIIDRPHTVAELEAGIIALPTAPISAGQSGGDTPFGTIGRGDATLQTGIHVLYRFHRDFAVGAGALFAPFPTSDKEYGGLRSLPRTHARGYFFFGTEGRYIPIHYRYFEAWVGVSLGGVVVADRFTTEAGNEVAPILGTREVTVRTEGFAAGVQLGASYYLSEHWIAGANFRAYRWVLPDSPRCSSIGDCATLSGSVETLEFGLTIGYRLPL